MVNSKNKEIESLNEDLFLLNQKIAQKETLAVDMKNEYDKVITKQKDKISALVYVTEPTKLSIEYHNELVSSRILISTLTRTSSYLGRKVEKLKQEYEKIKNSLKSTNVYKTTGNINFDEIEYDLNLSEDEYESSFSDEISDNSIEIDSPISYIDEKITEFISKDHKDKIMREIPKLNFNTLTSGHKKYGSYSLPKRSVNTKTTELEDKIMKLEKVSDKQKELYQHLKSKYTQLKNIFQKQRGRLRQYKGMLKTPHLTSKPNNNDLESMENNFDLEINRESVNLEKFKN